MPHDSSLTDLSLSVAGIDVSKAKLDVFVDTVDRHFCIDNTDAKVATLIDQLKQLKVRLVVVEATGRYHRRIAAALFEAGIPVAIANPQHTRHYAAASGLLEKTDKLDARSLAGFARSINPRTVQNPSEISTILGDLVSRRRALVQMRVAEKNRAHDDLPRFAASQSRKLLRLIEQQIEDLDREIAKHIEADDDSHNKSQIIDSVPGIGINSANQLLIELPELGNLSRAKIAKLAGLAPLNCDSGTFRGKRAIRGGRADVRTTLYMCAHNAVIRGDGRFRRFFDNLIAKGKLYKVAMTAVMRKLLITLNQMIKTNQHWESNLKPELT